ncbi:MAG: signal peptidase I [Deltaproteobacteria bacterium RIFOXYA12_FULL_61_11]|nr:MAG: signal peptidase I [Deltaproteobacteria bacterium RIFOXYA12_FULL_61_11]
MKQKLWNYCGSPRARNDVIFLIVLLCLHSSVFASYLVPTGSMQPTLREGERFFANKLAYRLKLPFTKTTLFQWAEPERGDIIVFKYPRDEAQTFTKRVVGLPGDRLELREKRLLINGEAVETRWLGQRGEYRVAEERFGETTHLVRQLPLETPFDTVRELTVPQGMLFVLGDNRDRSADSRSWGFVPLENVDGRLVLRWFSFEEGSWWPDFDRLGLLE